jgi:hypothetical protein
MHRNHGLSNQPLLGAPGEQSPQSQGLSPLDTLPGPGRGHWIILFTYCSWAIVIPSAGFTGSFPHAGGSTSTTPSLIHSVLDWLVSAHLELASIIKFRVHTLAFRFQQSALPSWKQAERTECSTKATLTCYCLRDGVLYHRFLPVLSFHLLCFSPSFLSGEFNSFIAVFSFSWYKCLAL